MNKRTLGSNGLEVSAIGVGCMTISTKPEDRTDAVAVLRGAVERGATFFDTAEAYGPFANEELVGEALGPVRDQVVIATKFGFALNADGTRRRAASNSRPEPHQGGGRGQPERLDTDRIDLFYQHRVDPDVPIEDVAGTVKDLITEGKVRHFGLSEAAVRTIRGPTPSPRRRAAERVLAVVARARDRDPATPCRAGDRVRAFSPLGKGFLTGTITADTPLDSNDWRTVLPRFAPDAVSGHLGLVQAVQQIAARHAATPGQIALAWLLARDPHIVPIPGTRRIERIEENLGAAEVQLTSDDLTELDRVSTENQVQGDRYPEQMQRLIDR